MIQFNVAYDKESKKVAVLPVDKDLPKNHTVAGVFDDRDLRLPLTQDQRRKELADSNKGEDPVLMHYVQTILLRTGVDDLSDVSVTVDKEVKTAVKNAHAGREHDAKQDPEFTKDEVTKLD